MARASKRVGRANFILRTLLVTAMGFAIEYLGVELLQLQLLPRYQYVLQRVLVFGLFGTFLMPTIEGRLLDAGLQLSYRFPTVAIWLLSITLPTTRSFGWTIGFALFALVMIAGGSIPGKPMVAERGLPGKASEMRLERTSAHLTIEKDLPKFPARLLVGPVGFLRSLLTIGCLWLPLIWLEGVSSHGACVWFARFGYSILTLVWFFKFLGRLGDAGRLPRPRYGYLTIFLVIFIEMLRRLGRRRGLWLGHAPLLANAVANLGARVKLINEYELFGLFMLAQIPFIFLPSKREVEQAILEQNTGRGSKRNAQSAKSNELALCGPFEFLRILAVIACIWIPLIYLDLASGGGVGSWVARAGYCILLFFWLTFADGRLKDAGWAHSEYPSQYFLVVSVASLMPLAVHWVNGYGALAIFFLIQTPTAILRSKPMMDEETATSVT